MTEDVARKKLAALGRHLIADWHSGRDWRWPDIGKESNDGPRAIVLDKKWPDYRSLAAASRYLSLVSEGITRGDPTFDNVPWEEVLMVVEKLTKDIERRARIEDLSVLKYLPNAATSLNPTAIFSRIFKRGRSDDDV